MIKKSLIIAAIATKSPVILSDSKDWNEWIELIKTAALRADIWLYINPETPENWLPRRIWPIRPTLGDVYETDNDNSIIKYSQLNKNEQEELRML